VIAKDNVCGKIATLDVTIVVYSCNPVGFPIFPSSFELEIEG
jgi:hypothetical protein